MYNANNYGYNPYNMYIPQNQNMQNSLQNSAVNNQMLQSQRAILSGKMCDTLETAKITEYPLDGSVSYFPLTDGSAIVTKQLQNDGTSKMIIYKPVKDEQKEDTKFVTFDELEKSMNDIVLEEINDLKDDIKDLKQEFKDLKKKKKDD